MKPLAIAEPNQGSTKVSLEVVLGQESRPIGLNIHLGPTMALELATTGLVPITGCEPQTTLEPRNLKLPGPQQSKPQ